MGCFVEGIPSPGSHLKDGRAKCVLLLSIAIFQRSFLERLMYELNGLDK